MRSFVIALSALLSAWLCLSAAHASTGKRVALIMGNSNYRHATPLPNPVNDAKAMSGILRAAGFTVIEGTDLDKAAMSGIIDRFTEAAFDAETALVFYAGHGLQVDGQNFIIPVDAELTAAAHLRTRAVPVDSLLDSLPPDPAVSIVILDACRDNPLARTLASSLPKSRSSSLGSGLAAVQASGEEHSTGGLLIAYATDPGAVALDGADEHSPYTAALIKHLTTPGLEIQSALTRVRAEVTETTLGRQRPWHNASLGREVFIGGAPVVASAATAAAPAPAAEAPLIVGVQPPPAGVSAAEWEVEQRVWDEASKRNTAAHYQYYLEHYPDGRFAGIAKLNLDGLKADAGQQSASLATEPAASVRAVVAPPEVVSAKDKAAPATSAETEAALGLDRERTVDLQLRLTALGFETGGFDGSIGRRTRTAIGEWQRANKLDDTTFLDAAQHLLIVTRSEPLVAAVREQFEKDKKAGGERAVVKAKPVKKSVKTVRTEDRAAPAKTWKPKAPPAQPKSAVTNGARKPKAAPAFDYMCRDTGGVCP